MGRPFLLDAIDEAVRRVIEAHPAVKTWYNERPEVDMPREVNAKSFVVYNTCECTATSRYCVKQSDVERGAVEVRCIACGRRHAIGTGHATPFDSEREAAADAR